MAYNQMNHFDDEGKAVMVEVGGKPVTTRTAEARGKIFLQEAVWNRIREGTVEKGDVCGVARIAGIMGTKKTAELIPLCHPLFLTGAAVDFVFLEEPRAIEVRCTVKTEGKTGVEMEALTGTMTALLTIYDMCKALDKSMAIGEVALWHKTGGKSGDFERKEYERSME